MHPPEDCHTHRVPPAVPTLNVADMLRRTAELGLERATHDARRAKAEADMAELLLERARLVQARLAMPDTGGRGPAS